MIPEILTFDLIPGKWESIINRFAEQGVIVPDSSYGEINQQGVKCEFRQDGKTLTVMILSKPFLASVEYVKEKLTNFINEA